ncbi:MAG TPA: hypothetical protein VGA99_07780 [bacterium]
MKKKATTQRAQWQHEVRGAAKPKPKNLTTDFPSAAKPQPKLNRKVRRKKSAKLIHFPIAVFASFAVKNFAEKTQCC